VIWPKFRAGLLVLIAGFLCVRAQGAEPVLSEGFEHFYNLEYPQAIQYFRAEVARGPQTPASHNHLAQAVLYDAMFHGGALESELVSGSNPFIRRDKLATSPEAAKTFDDEIATALSLAQTRLAKNEGDYEAWYASGVSYGLRANYNFLVRKAWMDALKDASAARNAHNRAAEINPGAMDARLIQGLYDYIVGSLPWHMKMLSFLAGYHGDRESGIKTIQIVSEKGVQNKYDARVLLAAIYRRERRPMDALPLLVSVSERFPRNYLFRLEMVQMYSDAGNKKAALVVLDDVETMKKAGAPSFATLPIEKIWYYRGNLLFWYRDYDTAIDFLRRVTSHTDDLDLHTSIMSWMRLGQSLDMKGRREDARLAYQHAIQKGPQTDLAKEARGYLSTRYSRNG